MRNNLYTKKKTENTICCFESYRQIQTNILTNSEENEKKEQTQESGKDKTGKSKDK